jgi:hypothetical protein
MSTNKQAAPGGRVRARIRQGRDRTARRGHRGAAPDLPGPAAQQSEPPLQYFGTRLPRGFADLPHNGFSFIVEPHGSYRHTVPVLLTVLHDE